MEIAIGAEVVGTSGTLGQVHRFIFGVGTQQVNDLVVRSGLLGHERAVPISCVTSAEPMTVHVDMDEDKFERAYDYTEAGYHAPEIDYEAPPAMQDSGQTGFDYQEGEAWARGAVSGPQSKAMGYPGGEQIVPQDQQRIVIAKGTPVFDAHSEEIGRVEEVSADLETGNLLRMALTLGGFIGETKEIPADWIESIGFRGVLLRVDKEDLDHLKAA